MTRMNGQTKIIVATACALALVDIGVRLLAPNPGASSCGTCPALSGGDGVLTARAVRLVDNDGNVRGLWNTDANGEPALWMYDRNGATRIELDTTENTPSLSLHDNDGNRRVYFGMDNADGTGLYQMMEPDSETATFSISGSDNRPRLDLNGDGDYSQTVFTARDVTISRSLSQDYNRTRATYDEALVQQELQRHLKQAEAQTQISVEQSQ